uniref:Uncharacterized protein n=1 Tax=Romanomermis culicivorax TaxID=13658 RepID=A0A915JQJ1_ROMCU
MPDTPGTENFSAPDPRPDLVDKPPNNTYQARTSPYPSYSKNLWGIGGSTARLVARTDFGTSRRSRYGLLRRRPYTFQKSTKSNYRMNDV